MNAAHRPAQIRWYHSLILRTMLLCGILVLCLLGAVCVITAHYYTQVKSEMEAETARLESQFLDYVEEHPHASLEDLPREMAGAHGNDDTIVRLDETEADAPAESFSIRFEEGGGGLLVTERLIQHGERWILMTVLSPLKPQTEILRAFRNEYLLAITAVFFLVIGAMVYFIWATLRPLRGIKETCARISRGDLQPVELTRSAGEVYALEETFNQMVASLQEKEVIEAKLRQAHRLSAIGNLAAGVAHDLRNPLNAIKLLTSHSMDAVRKQPDSEPAVRQLETVRSEIRRMEDIVSGFLSLAREQEMQTEPSRVDALLEECARLVRQDAKARDVRLSTDLNAGDVELDLDPRQWSRAVLNVLINALEASRAGATVRLSSRVADGSVEISVNDEGPGLTPEAIEHAFDPYYTTKPSGTGLGLSITRGVIEEHGGTIDLLCELNRGCRAVITMPLPDELNYAPPGAVRRPVKG